MRAHLLLFFAFLGLACGRSDEILRPEGTTAEITVADGKKHVAELLAFQDSSLIFLTERIEHVPLRNVSNITLKNVDRYLGWVPDVIIGEGIPTLIMLAAMDDKGPGFVAAAFTVMTWFLLDSGTPQLEFPHPLSPGDIDRLRLYVRYPQGLTDKQLHSIEAPMDSLRSAGPVAH